MIRRLFGGRAQGAGSKKRFKKMRWGVLVLIVGVALAVGGVVAMESGSVSQPGTTSADLVHTASLPLDGGQVHTGKLLGRVGQWFGLDEQTIADALDFRIDVSSAAGRGLVSQLQSLTGGVVTTDVKPDRLVITLDRLRLRQNEKQLRTRFRGMVETLFPQAAAAVKARYGMRIYLDEKPPAQQPDPAQFGDGRRVVVLVHGLDEPGRVWMVLRPALLRAGMIVADFEYPNDQPIDESSQLLAEELRRVKTMGVDRVSLVGHSMGGLVSRHVLTDPRWYAGAGRGHDDLPGVDRLIMIGTPQHGSQMARLRIATEIRDHVMRSLSGDGMIFDGFFDGAGEAKIDLLPGSRFLTTLNNRPHPEGVTMTIIAGRASPVTPDRIVEALDGVKDHLDVEQDTIDGLRDGLHGLVAGVGDGAVSLRSSRLDGVEDYVLVDGTHLSIIRNVMESSTRVPPAVPLVLDRLAESNDASRPDRVDPPEEDPPQAAP